MNLPVHLRWFWRIYIPVSSAFLLTVVGMPLGPVIEERLFPVRVDQRIEDIVRTPERVCWTWVSVKVRPLAADNMDVFLDASGDRMVVAIVSKDTGLPWGAAHAVSVGPHRQTYCLTLPPNVGPDDAIRVEQTAYYPGFLGLWHVALRLPDVVSPPGAVVP